MENKTHLLNPQDLSLKITYINLKRWKPFALIIICIELVLSVILMLSRSYSGRFQYDVYAFMYLLMIAITGLTWTVFIHLEPKLSSHFKYVKRTNMVMVIYLTFIMIWGAVISLFDQTLYGNIAAFIMNMLLGSFMFYMPSRRLLIPQVLASLTIIIGLPFFQPSTNILIGHYANLIIFLIFSIVLARTNYHGLTQNYLDQKNIENKTALLAQVNQDLMLEINARQQIQAQLEAANMQLASISYLDGLTGIPNRRKLEEDLDKLWSLAMRGNYPLGIMMIDIDLFKLYNDTYGHPAGDNCLQSVAQILGSFGEETDSFVARYGGEEFLFVTTGLSQEDTWELGEKIRIKIEALHLVHASSSVSPYITVSVGISWQIPDTSDKLSAAIDRADQAMYQAKRTSRNRAVLAE